LSRRYSGPKVTRRFVVIFSCTICDLTVQETKDSNLVCVHTIRYSVVYPSLHWETPAQWWWEGGGRKGCEKKNVRMVIATQVCVCGSDVSEFVLRSSWPCWGLLNDRGKGVTSGHGTVACDERIGLLGSRDVMTDRLAAGRRPMMTVDERRGERGALGCSILVGEEVLSGGRSFVRSEAFRGGTAHIPSSVTRDESIVNGDDWDGDMGIGASSKQKSEHGTTDDASLTHNRGG
jgi:hypothetical protein